MTDTTPNTPKATRERMPVIGQRVPKDIRDQFNKIAKDSYNTTPANLLRALMEAITKQPGKGKTEPLKVQVSAGVTRDEVSRIVSQIVSQSVRKELAAFFPAGTPKTTNDIPAITPEAPKATETYNENTPKQEPTEEEKSLAAEFEALAKSVKFEKETLYLPASLTSHDNGDSLKPLLKELGLTRLWQGPQQVSTITKPNGELTTELARVFYTRFKAAWIASRLKK